MPGPIVFTRWLMFSVSKDEVTLDEFASWRNLLAICQP